MQGHPGTPFVTLLDELKESFQALAMSDDPRVQRQVGLGEHLHSEMSERHLLNFLLPIERLLDRRLADHDFLIHDQDRSDFLNADTRITLPLILILDNLRSAFNVGSILRMAEGLSAAAVWLCGYTPSIDSKGLQKTAMGIEKLVSTRHFMQTKEALELAKSEGYSLVGLETSREAQSLYEKPLPTKIAILVGNERFGLDYQSLQVCDEIRQIPMLGYKNSLNVASALAIASFEWQRQQHVHAKS